MQARIRPLHRHCNNYITKRGGDDASMVADGNPSDVANHYNDQGGGVDRNDAHISFDVVAVCDDNNHDGDDDNHDGGDKAGSSGGDLGGECSRVWSFQG